MPRGDGTGPMGIGRMTGRGAGFCAGYTVPGYMNPGPGYGFGFGRGRGFGRRFYPAGMLGWAQYGYPAYGSENASGTNEKEILGNQAEFLEDQLQQVKMRLKKLKEETE